MGEASSHSNARAQARRKALARHGGQPGRLREDRGTDGEQEDMGLLLKRGYGLLDKRSKQGALWEGNVASEATA